MDIVECRDPGQIRDLAALARTVWEEHYTPIVGKAAVDYMVREFQSEKPITEQIAAGCRYFALLEDGRCAAYCAVKPDGDAVFLSKLYTAREHRGKGYAKALLSHAVKSLGHREPVRVRLMVNRDNAGSIAAYERMGLRVTGEVTNDIGGGFVMKDYEMEGLYAAE